MKEKSRSLPFVAFFSECHEYVLELNKSKYFIGLVVITLNIATRFVDIKLSKTVESYLKHTLSRNILIFCIAFMGSKDIYVSIIAVFVFSFCMDYIFNENSKLCILPESFTTYHVSLINNSQGNGANNKDNTNKNILLKS